MLVLCACVLDFSLFFQLPQGALKVVQPSMKREGFATIPAVTWEDVGALEDIREELCLAIKVRT